MENISVSMTRKLPPSAVTIGKFDGVHTGHQLLLSSLLKKENKGLLAAAVTFDVPPAAVFEASSSRKQLQKTLLTNEERLHRLREYGIKTVVEYPFDEKMMRMPAEQFVKQILCEQLQVKYLAVGEDFAFGYQRKGNVELLQRMSAECGFFIDIVEKKRMNGEIVSSTRIRKKLEQGRLEEVNQLLGYDFFIEGVVVKGNRLGRTWGIPTINIKAGEQKLLPPDGVYFSRISVEGKNLTGITDIGYKPTVDQGSERGIETHIFSFDEELYGKEVRISLLHFHREEKKFENLEGLINCLNKDIKLGKEYFEL